MIINSVSEFIDVFKSVDVDTQLELLESDYALQAGVIELTDNCLSENEGAVIDKFLYIADIKDILQAVDDWTVDINAVPSAGSHFYIKHLDDVLRSMWIEYE